MMARVFRTLLVGLVAITPVATLSQDVVDLAGVRPGEVLTAVADNSSVAESANPFVFFGVPTRLPALAAIFPSGEAYALKEGIVAGIRWERTYSSQRECEAAVESARALLRPYFPSAVSGDDAPRYQFQSADGLRGVGFSCRANQGGYHQAMIEFVHFETDRQLSQILRPR
jgi:hypothetical protein